MDTAVKSREEMISEVLEKSLYLNESEGGYSYEIYVDPNDELSEKQIIAIAESDTPMDTFYDQIDDYAMHCVFHDENFLYQELIKELRKLENWQTEMEEGLTDFLQEKITYNFPYDHYLQTTVAVDILIDTGDGNYDYVLNSVYPHYNGTYGERIEDKASLVWLTRQQGYGKRTLNKALRHESFGESKYLESVHVELHNCSSSMNALSFYVSMSMQEYIALKEQMKTGKGFIKIDKETTCGLVDIWYGAGSVLDIQLEKDVIVPMKYIGSALPDCCHRYRVQEIYGVCRSMWREDGVKLIA